MSNCQKEVKSQKPLKYKPYKTKRIQIQDFLFWGGGGGGLGGGGVEGGLESEGWGQVGEAKMLNYKITSHH